MTKRPHKLSGNTNDVGSLESSGLERHAPRSRERAGRREPPVELDWSSTAYIPLPPSPKSWDTRDRGDFHMVYNHPKTGPVIKAGIAACRAGDPSGQGKDPSSEGLGGHDLLTQADAGCPAGQVVGHRLYRQPGAVGGEAAGRHVVQSDTVLEVAYRILDLGVTAMIGLQFQHLPIAVGDEAVIAVGGEEGQLGTGRGLHPPDDEPHRRGVGLTLEWDIGGLCHIGAPSIQ